MRNWLQSLSKKWSVIHLVFGLSIPVYVFFVVLFHESRLHADQELAGIETPFFSSCQGIRLVEQDPYEAYVKRRGTPRPTEAQMIPDGFFSVRQIEESSDSRLFFQKVRKKVHEYHHISSFHAQMLKGCFNLLNKGDTSFFASFEKPPTFYRDYCVLQVRSLVEAVEEAWPRMHVALALSRPRYREDRLLQDESTQFHNAPQHAVSDVATLEPLSPAERGEAVRQYQAELKRLRDEFNEKFRGTRTVSLPDSEDHYVLSRLDAFRESQRKTYLNILERIPLMAYLGRANPGSADYVEALNRIIRNSESALTRLQEKGDREPDLYAVYAPIINHVLEESPAYCGIAHEWIKGFNTKQNIRFGAKVGVQLIMFVTPFVTESLLVKAGVQVTGSVFFATQLKRTYRDYRVDYDKALSSVMNHEGLTDFDKLRWERQKVILGALFLADDIIKSAETSLALQKAATEFLKARKILL